MPWLARPSKPGPQRIVDGPRLTTRLLTALLVALVVMLVDLSFGGRGVLAPLELQTLDWRFRLRGRIAPSGEVALVLADDATVTALGTWPPPRDVLARAIELLHRAGAGVIVLDFLLAEPPEGTSSAADQALARAVATAGNVVLVYAFIAVPGPISPPPDWLAATAYRAPHRSAACGVPALGTDPAGCGAGRFGRDPGECLAVARSGRLTACRSAGRGLQRGGLSVGGD